MNKEKLAAHLKEWGYSESYMGENRLPDSYDNENLDVVIFTPDGSENFVSVGIIPYPSNKAKTERLNGFGAIKGYIDVDTYGINLLKDILEVCTKYGKKHFGESQ